MKKSYGILLSLVAGIIAFWIIFTQFSFKEIVGHLRNAPLWAIFAYLGVSILIMLMHSWRWHYVLKTQKYQLPFKDVFWYKVIGYAVSYLTPGAKLGGEAVRAGLMRRQNIPFHEAMSSIVIDKIMEVSTYGAFFIIGALVVFGTLKLPLSISITFIIISVWFLGFMGIFYYQMLHGGTFFKSIFRFFRIHKLKKGKAIEKKLIEMEKLVSKFYRHHKKAFARSMLISFGAWVLMFAEFELILVMLGITNATFLQLFLIITFIGASFLLPVPMALGALEAGQLSVFKMIKMSGTAGIALALITRTRDILWTAIGFLALTLYGFKLSNNLDKEPELEEKK